MASLSDSDLRKIIGPDYERVLSTSVEVNATSTPEEHAASRGLRSKKLSDMSFTFYAVLFAGVALVVGSLYSGVGLGSVQGLIGVGIAALGIAGLVFIFTKSRAISREAEASQARV